MPRRGVDGSSSRTEEVLVSFAFVTVNLTYSVLFSLLLVNLLIAMMNDTYNATMKEAELDWRVNYAANLLRYKENYMYLVLLRTICTSYYYELYVPRTTTTNSRVTLE